MTVYPLQRRGRYHPKAYISPWEEDAEAANEIRWETGLCERNVESSVLSQERETGPLENRRNLLPPKDQFFNWKFFAKSYASKDLSVPLADLREELFDIEQTDTDVDQAIRVFMLLIKDRSYFAPDFFEIRWWMRFISEKENSAAWSEYSNETIPEITFESPEIEEQLERYDLKSDMHIVAMMAKKAYTNLQNIKVLLEHDPEIPDTKTFRLTLRVTGSPEDILKQESYFKKNFVQALAPDVRQKITFTYELG